MRGDHYMKAYELDGLLTDAVVNDPSDADLRKAWLDMAPVMIALERSKAAREREAVSPLSETAA